MKPFYENPFAKTILLFLLIFFAGWRSNSGASDESWFNNSATFSISPKFSLKLTQETRCLDITYSDPYLNNVQGGIAFNLPKNFYIATLYKREHVKIQDAASNENRITLEAGWKTKASKDLDIDLRFRTEIREYEEDEQEDHLRFRMRIRGKYNMTIGKLNIKPFVALETFGKNKVYTVQRTRLYIGTIFPLSNHVEFHISYLWLATRNKESIHILHSGFDLKF